MFQVLNISQWLLERNFNLFLLGVPPQCDLPVVKEEWLPFPCCCHLQTVFFFPGLDHFYKNTCQKIWSESFLCTSCVNSLTCDAHEWLGITLCLSVSKKGSVYSAYTTEFASSKGNSFLQKFQSSLQINRSRIIQAVNAEPNTRAFWREWQLTQKQVLCALIHFLGPSLIFFTISLWISHKM